MGIGTLSTIPTSTTIAQHIARPTNPNIIMAATIVEVITEVVETAVVAEMAEMAEEVVVVIKFRLT